MIGSRITPRLGDDPKIRCAIGTPEASVFFDPQKTAAVRSSAGNRSRRQARLTPPSITVRIAAEPTIAVTTTPVPCLVQTPCCTESQNEV